MSRDCCTCHALEFLVLQLWHADANDHVHPFAGVVFDMLRPLVVGGNGPVVGNDPVVEAGEPVLGYLDDGEAQVPVQVVTIFKYCFFFVLICVICRRCGKERVMLMRLMESL